MGGLLMLLGSCGKSADEQARQQNAQQQALQKALADSLAEERAKDRRMRFLREIPLDPMTGTTDWGLRSVQDDPDSNSWGGQDVFDVYTKSNGTGLDGTKYSTW